MDQYFEFHDDSLNQKCLTSCLSFLCENLFLEEIIVYLQSDFILTVHQAESIRAGRTPYENNATFIRYIQQLGPNAFNCFVKSLEQSGQKYIRQYILDERIKIAVQSSMSHSPSHNSMDNLVRQLTLQSILSEMQPEADSIEDWDKGDPLGQGAVGDVYKCIIRANGRELAGKYIRMTLPTILLPSDKPRIKNDIALILKEVTFMKNLEKHERVVECFGIMATDVHFLVIFTELMHNGSILDEIRRYGDFENKKGLDQLSVVKYLRQTTEGLVYIHSKGILHQDIKSANLLLDADKNVKLADFGTSIELRLRNDLTASTIQNRSRGLKGTYLYMAPELLRGEKYSRKADVWSIGCCGVEMLTTMAPHADTTNGWEPATFLFKAGNGELQYVGSELCPNASVHIQKVLDKTFQPVALRLTSEQLLSEIEAV